jgi:hypothetical protein
MLTKARLAEDGYLVRNSGLNNRARQERGLDLPGTEKA